MTDRQASYVKKLLEHMSLRLSPDELQLASTFASTFWSRTPEEDLALRLAEDDAGATIHMWRKFRDRQPDAVQIEVLNPSRSRHGWSSRYTVVMVMTPDMPFVVDSVLIALSHGGLITHHLSNVVFPMLRNDQGQLIGIVGEDTLAPRELMIFAEIDRVTDPETEVIRDRLEGMAAELVTVVGDFTAMKTRLVEIKAELTSQRPQGLDEAEVTEGVAFLDWLGANNFTFLGYREFEYHEDRIRQTGQSLGSLRSRNPASERRLSDQSAATRSFLLEEKLISFSKSGTKSRVHRHAYPDYVGIKLFDGDGKVVGERGFLGLYTSPVYREHPGNIPIVRRKVAAVMDRSNLNPAGFDGKVLAQVLATFPRDELLQISEQELYEVAMAVTYIHERRRLRVFTRFAPYGLFVNCLVYLPRDLFNTQSRTRIQEYLNDAFDAEDSDFDVFFSESILVRLQFTLRIMPGSDPAADHRRLERAIGEITGDWVSDLNEALRSSFGESLGRQLYREYAHAFPAGYREHVNVRIAADDVASIQALSAARPLLTRFHRPSEDPRELVHLKVFRLQQPLSLSEIIPELENMGLHTLGEQASMINRASGPCVSIQDFHVRFHQPLELARIGERFDDAFVRIRAGRCEDDGFNRLILNAALTWRQVSVLRAYARYMKQIRFGFSQEFISDTLARHCDLATLLVSYFEQRFHPQTPQETCDDLRRDILERLESVQLLNEDRILRRFLVLISATRRTNYYVLDPDGANKSYLSLKLAPKEIGDMPRPLPAHEIFVYAPDFEGVHLRGGSIARGGLRWSDRLEDYRTEVLGLVKAQAVKNAVIVPTGAKGGFVLKAVGKDPELQDAVRCYRDFISAMLDVTDNIIDGQVQAPPNVRRYDDDDPYLVVAADKGTASFSDEANGVAARYRFWLGDAFASGGSNGYDHKAMGITARGAWVSVQRHFAERHIDVQTDPVTVVGIGDMGGDVFGNGMLLSDSIKLLAAFNHRQIFIDPEPDPAASHAERQRLFELPSSAWSDYASQLISAGGGVFERDAKSITITPEMKTAFHIDVEALAPDDLISALLRAPVQLIWNGGIGTYIKATRETHEDVGDRANDHLRIDAAELRCEVFGEGGNLGMTQRARVEFSLAGGSVNTDFIDNSAGVDCSDHEVNIKIALNGIVARGELTLEERNSLLKRMTDEITALVLNNNYRQAQALSLAVRHSSTRQPEYQRLITWMETEHTLDRPLEHLPSDEELAERFGRDQPLTKPELAVLLAYAKTYIKSSLVNSTIHEDLAIQRELLSAFPPTLAARYEAPLMDHRLRGEIISTQLANKLVDTVGISFVTHLMEFVGGTVEDVIRAFYVASESFSIPEWYASIESLPSVAAPVKLDMLVDIMQLGRRTTRWLLRHRRDRHDVAMLITSFRSHVTALTAHRAELIGPAATKGWRAGVTALRAAGVPAELADKSANAAGLTVALPIIDAAERADANPLDIAKCYAELGKRLNLGWLTEQLAGLEAASHWQAMERDSLHDDVTTEQCLLAALSLKQADGDVGAWLDGQRVFVDSWQRVITQAEHASVYDFSMYSMTCRKLTDLCRAVSVL